MKISLIIVTYNRPEALSLILKSIEKQKVLPNEVVIADDGSGKETQELIHKFRKKFPVPLLHVWHEDKGFRAAAIRNSAIKTSSCDYLIFSDGDLFFHPCFIRDFKTSTKPGEALIGSRVFLKHSATVKRISSQNCKPVFPLTFSEIETNRLNAVRFPLINKFFKPLNYSSKLRGGLLGVWRKDILAVNGWNEEFTGWGLEDTELVARLFNNGTIFRKIKFQAITYHLWHEIQSREQFSDNQKLLDKTVQKKLSWCKKGLTADE
ncbi:MAG: glycosyltransferase family 2 protein [Mariniphaga sp.]|nr:glycosyltransferase family 2 protein [Mariniphaga sp.]